MDSLMIVQSVNLLSENQNTEETLHWAQEVTCDAHRREKHEQDWGKRASNVANFIGWCTACHVQGWGEWEGGGGGGGVCCLDECTDDVSDVKVTAPPTLFGLKKLVLNRFTHKFHGEY